MITQDNRNNSSDNSFDKKIQHLKQLLEISENQDPSSFDPQKTPKSETNDPDFQKKDSPDTPPHPFSQITISGNNNIVSTKEIIVVQETKKNSFWKSIFFSVIFF